VTYRPYRLGQGTGPLRGVKVVELAGIGPGPHACMILADLGADVVRVDRPGGAALSTGDADVMNRGRPRVEGDLKTPEGIALVLDLVERSDVLVEGMRPGATERLGLGPDDCWARNPALVYGRMTGWGQEGPLAQTAGHDLNYLGVAGVLDGLGQDPARPHFPGNLLGDFGGGSTYLVVGVLAALLEARVSGQGQVVDAAIVDGAAHLQAIQVGLLAAGMAGPRRLSGVLDGGAPFYDVYETSDGQHLTVAPLEPAFWSAFRDVIGVELPDRDDPSAWPELRRVLTETFRSRTRAEWLDMFDGSDACVGPVTAYADAAGHPHLAARGTFVEHGGVVQPAPAPRFSRTAATLRDYLPRDEDDVLRAWGVERTPG
jgi:alpha-methylacyl-CoA racemase